jgi:hypothetical protein
MDVADAPTPLELRLPAVPPSVAEARAALTRFAADAGADPADVELAVAGLLDEFAPAPDRDAAAGAITGEG